MNCKMRWMLLDGGQSWLGKILGTRQCGRRLNGRAEAGGISPPLGTTLGRGPGPKS